MALAGGLEKRFDAAEGNLADFGGDDFRVAEVRNEMLLDDLGSDEVGGSAEHVGVLIARSGMRMKEEELIRIDEYVGYGGVVFVVDNDVIRADTDFLHALTEQNSILIRSLHYTKYIDPYLNCQESSRNIENLRPREMI